MHIEHHAHLLCFSNIVGKWKPLLLIKVTTGDYQLLTLSSHTAVTSITLPTPRDLSGLVLTTSRFCIHTIQRGRNTDAKYSKTSQMSWGHTALTHWGEYKVSCCVLSISSLSSANYGKPIIRDHERRPCREVYYMVYILYDHGGQVQYQRLYCNIMNITNSSAVSYVLRKHH